jgi:YHS domain-containing protein
LKKGEKIMKKIGFVIALLIVAGLIGYGSMREVKGKIVSQDPQPQKTEAVVPLTGLDPVMLVQGKELKGKAEFSVTRGQFNYWFANTENKATFEKDPARYEIQGDGSCAVVPDAKADPDRYIVYKGRIYIFATSDCVEEFKASPDSFAKP